MFSYSSAAAQDSDHCGDSAPRRPGRHRLLFVPLPHLLKGWFCSVVSFFVPIRKTDRLTEKKQPTTTTTSTLFHFMCAFLQILLLVNPRTTKLFTVTNKPRGGHLDSPPPRFSKRLQIKDQALA